jgi:hypothetical protein
MSRDEKINSYPGKGFEPCPTDFGWIPLNVPMDLNVETAKLVRAFSESLALKLYQAQQKYGYTDNWKDPEWMDKCRADLREHLEKGDPRDVAAYCAFLWHHNEPTNKENKNETE